MKEGSLCWTTATGDAGVTEGVMVEEDLACEESRGEGVERTGDLLRGISFVIDLHTDIFM